VNAVAVEVAAGGRMLGGAGAGMPGQDLGIATRHACVQGVGDGRMLQGGGLMWRGIPAALAIRVTIR
jgi:hypothetical protein